MEQNQVKQERRPWAGEALWDGQPPDGRTVRVTPAEGGRFTAVGRAGRDQAFEVALRPEQLWRFRQQMERSGAVVDGLPSWTGPGSGEAPARRPVRGPIGTDGDEKPPESPTQPKALAGRPPSPGV